MKNSVSTPTTPSGDSPSLDEIKKQILSVYPVATDEMISRALDACQKELKGDNDTGRLIRCVCERITA